MLQPEKTTLSNGIRVVSVTMSESTSASLRFMIKAGSAFESKDEQGISHFAEHMLFQGTDRHPSFGAIGKAIESIGGAINGQTGHLTTTYLVKLIPEHLETGFDVLSDLLLHSRLDPNDINRERQIVLEEISRRHDRPDEYVWSMFERELWPNQAMGRETLGTPETLNTFDRAELTGYLFKHYNAANLVVAAAGPFPHDQVVELATRYLGGTVPGTPTPIPQPSFGPGREVSVEHRPTAQVHLCLGFPAFGYTDPRIHAFHVLSTILGRGISSRLFSSIRERLGIAYSVGSSVLDFVVTGGVAIHAGLRTDRLSEAIETMIWELERLKNQPIGEDELSRAKEMDKAAILFGLERVEVVADHFGGQELLLGYTRPVEQDIEHIDKTNVDELHELSKSIFSFGDLKAAAIGELSQDSLERFLDQSLGPPKQSMAGGGNV